nr:ATP-binding protein [Oscillospiraceae bacterium]
AFWQKSWLLPAFMTVTVMFFTCDFTPEKAGSSGFLLSRVLLLLCAAIAYFFMPDILDSVRRQAALKEQAAIQEHLLQLQQEQHGQLLKHMEEVKAARHDLRQNLSVIRAYLEQNDIEGLKTYLGVYEKSLSSGTYRTFTRNFALNAVCVYYAGEARKYAIDYNISLDMPEQLPLNEPEICAMLGNLLENAIDACREVKCSVPFIRGRGRCEKDCIVLTMDNSCEREPIWENGRLLSSKHDGFGSGTWIVRGMAERCGGVAEFSYKNGVFSTSVLLYG